MFPDMLKEHQKCLVEILYLITPQLLLHLSDLLKFIVYIILTSQQFAQIYYVYPVKITAMLLTGFFYWHSIYEIRVWFSNDNPEFNVGYNYLSMPHPACNMYVITFPHAMIT